MLNGFSQQSASGIKRESWASSGDTSYYDARDRFTGDELEEDDLNAGLSVVDTPQDLQRAHDTATAYYDNTAYLPDNAPAITGSRSSADTTLRGAFYKKKKAQPKKLKKRPPAHLAAETNVDSGTTGGEYDSTGGGIKEETEDDFGFKFRPSIPPPRPLLQSAPNAAPPVGWTLEDTLSLKRANLAEATAPPAVPANGPNGLRSSGILLETNIDSELDDNSSIPSSYYPDRMRRPEQQLARESQQPKPQPQPQPQPQPLLSSLRNAQENLDSASPSNSRPQQPVLPMAAFHFNTAVREEDEETDATAAIEDDDADSSGTAQAGFREEVPRMASANGWSPRSPLSPSGTVIENNSSNNRPLPSPYKSPAATSLSLSANSQVATNPQQYPLPMPPRMKARLDTDFEVSSDEMDFTETTPGDMAILEYSRALEEAERMHHFAGGNYVFAKPPASQITNSVPDYINYVGRDTGTMLGSVGLRAKSMNTLTASRNSLRSSGVSGKELLTPGRARRASLRRSRLGLDSAGGIYSIPVFDDSNPTLVSGNSLTQFAGPRHLSGELDQQVPEVQHHGPVRSSRGKSLGCLERCDNACCPNTPRRILFRWLLIVGIVVCCIVIGVIAAVIVVNTRPKDTSGT